MAIGKFKLLRKNSEQVKVFDWSDKVLDLCFGLRCFLLTQNELSMFTGFSPKLVTQ
jgi:hypothetical protein